MRLCADVDLGAEGGLKLAESLGGNTKLRSLSLNCFLPTLDSAIKYWHTTVYKEKKWWSSFSRKFGVL